jgi:hypothetical protein
MAIKYHRQNICYGRNISQTTEKDSVTKNQAGPGILPQALLIELKAAVPLHFIEAGCIWSCHHG